MFLSLESSILHFFFNFLEILVLSYDFYDFGSVQIRAEMTLFLIGILHGWDQKRIQIFHMTDILLLSISETFLVFQPDTNR